MLTQRFIRYMSIKASSELPKLATAKVELKQEDQGDKLGRDDDLYRFLKIKCSGHEPAVLDSYEKFLKLAANHLDIEYVRTEEPFRTIKRRTLLRSRFVHKKNREQYEIRNYYRYLLFKNLTGSTADTFLEYIERNLPEGILFEAEKSRLAELPFELTNK